MRVLASSLTSSLCTEQNLYIELFFSHTRCALCQLHEPRPHNACPTVELHLTPNQSSFDRAVNTTVRDRCLQYFYRNLGQRHAACTFMGDDRIHHQQTLLVEMQVHSCLVSVLVGSSLWMADKARRSRGWCCWEVVTKQVTIIFR